MPAAKIKFEGHILDSLLLPKVLDLIIESDAEYVIEEIHIGRTRHDQSSAVIWIEAEDEAVLAELLTQSEQHGAVRIEDAS